MNTNDIVDYYPALLIKQYAGLAKAQATIRTWVTAPIMPQVTTQHITFLPIATTGTFTFVYGGVSTASINWNDSTATIQSRLRAITGLSSVTVTGDVTSTIVNVTFTGVTPPALLLEVGTNTLSDGTDAVTINISETDQTLPLAVQDSFNLNPNIAPSGAVAVGSQLDTIGKYVGVTRTGVVFSGQTVTLDDTDYLQLLYMAIIVNNSGSSLETIQNYLQAFFPGTIYVTDYKNMRLSYFILSFLGSSNLIQMMITKGLLPKPMGVGASAAVVPTYSVFAFRTYANVMPRGTPFNQYTAWNLSWLWLSYANLL